MAYLGNTTDPSGLDFGFELPDLSGQLNADTREIIDAFRRVSTAQREAVRAHAELLRSRNAPDGEESPWEMTLRLARERADQFAGSLPHDQREALI
jgi:hypothetical protein